MTGDRNGKIRERAYLLWEQEGRPDGREQEFWLRAEHDVSNEAKPAPRRIKAASVAAMPDAPKRKPRTPKAAAVASKTRARSAANGKAVSVKA
jgi:hypothetical protein